MLSASLVDDVIADQFFVSSLPRGSLIMSWVRLALQREYRLLQLVDAADVREQFGTALRWPDSASLLKLGSSDAHWHGFDDDRRVDIILPIAALHDGLGGPRGRSRRAISL